MAAAAGEARRVLVYGGRGALGSRCVQAFRARNWVIRPGLRGLGRSGTLVIGEQRGLPVQLGRADWIKPGPLRTPRRECLHEHAQVYVPGYECVPTPRPTCRACALQGGEGWGCWLRLCQA